MQTSRQIRNPKAEGRKKAEIRKPKRWACRHAMETRRSSQLPQGSEPTGYDGTCGGKRLRSGRVRISGFGFLSAFGLRISAFTGRRITSY
jgi:hypothetical protein